MKFNVTNIDYDFNDGNSNLSDDYRVTLEEMQQIIEETLGVWEADDEDDLIEEITTSSGWCIKSIDYDIQLEDYSLGNQDDTFIDINNTGGKY